MKFLNNGLDSSQYIATLFVYAKDIQYPHKGWNFTDDCKKCIQLFPYIHGSCFGKKNVKNANPLFQSLECFIQKFSDQY